MSEALEFWKAVGAKPIKDFDELKVGEVFLVEIRGKRHAARVVSRDGDTFACRNVSMDELGEHYKVWIVAE